MNKLEIYRSQEPDGTTTFVVLKHRNMHYQSNRLEAATPEELGLLAASNFMELAEDGEVAIGLEPSCDIASLPSSKPYRWEKRLPLGERDRRVFLDSFGRAIKQIEMRQAAGSV